MSTSLAGDAASAVVDALARDAATSKRSWRRVTQLWQVAFYLGLAVVAVVMSAKHDPWYLYAIVAAIGASYTFLLMPVMTNDEKADLGRYLAHIAIVTAGTVLTLWRDPDLSFLAFLVLTQFSPVIERRLSGVAIVAGASGVFGLALTAGKDWTADAWSAGAATGISGFVFTMIIGLFTGELIGENTRRGKLLRALDVAHAELERLHHEAGVVEERERLAREIHDTLAQGFTSVLMLVQAAEASLDSDVEATRERLVLAGRTARENLAEARSLVGALAPVDLDGTGLETALRRVASRVGAELRMDVQVRTCGEPQELSANVQVVLLRVAQEALANVRKHARASGVRLELAYGDAAVRLTARDDGVGFDASGSAGSGDSAALDDAGSADGHGLGFGLRSMRSRVEQVAGTWSLASTPGTGTTITAEVPYR